MASKTLEIAARIANPFQDTDLGACGRDELEAAAETLLRGKVSLLGPARRYGASSWWAPLEKYAERDRAQYRAQRGEFERVREAFAQASIPAMLFKSTGIYPSFHYTSSNLDVIVPDGRAEDARRRLVELGYVELLNVEEPRKYLFRRFPGDGGSFAFHLHEVVGWGVPFLDNEPLWRNSRPAGDDPDIIVPGPVEALLVTLAHWFYEDKELSLGNLIGTAWAVRHLDRPMPDAAKAAAQSGWEEGYWAALDIADRAWRRLYGESLLNGEQREKVDGGLGQNRFVTRRLLPSVRYEDRNNAAVVPFARNKVVYYRKLLRDPSRSRSRRLKDIVATLLWAVRWKLHIRSQRPVLIAIGGCDGAGKTLQAERLEGVFQTCDIRTRMVWSRGASSRFIGWFIRAGKRLARRGGGGGGPAEGAGEEARMDERRRSMENPLLRFLFSVMYALDLAWIYCVKTRFWLWTGHVVISDRYQCDAMVDYSLFSGQPAAGPPLALRWLRFLAPRPAITAILDVEPEEALRRKPEEGGCGHLQAARSAYLELAEANRYHVFPPEWTAEAINRHLARQSLEKFYERYGTVLNWLLWSNPGQLNRRRAGDGSRQG